MGSSVSSLLKAAFERAQPLARSALDLLVPPICDACGRPTAEPHALCGACWAQIHWIERPYCERLGLPFTHDLGAGALSAEAIAHPPPYRRARAAAIHTGIARQLVVRMKFADAPDLGRGLARAMVRAGADLFEPGSVLVPVPLHRLRLLERQFNQAAVLGAHIAREARLVHAPLALTRIRATQHQVGLNGPERHANVRGAFRVLPDQKRQIDGRSVILVDDVLTTGATVAACTRALQRAGAASVDVLTFSRVVPGHDDAI
jgi:ComF family protein